MASTYGISGSIFGVPVWTGYVVQTTNETYKPNVNEVIHNETGSVICRRLDDVQRNITIEAIVTSAVSSSAQIVTSLITYNGTDYIVETVKNAYKNKGFLVVTFDAVSSANISV